LTDHGLTAALGNLVAGLPGRAEYRAPEDLCGFEARFQVSVYFCVAALLEPFGASLGASHSTSSDEESEIRLELVLTDSELVISLGISGINAAAPAVDDAAHWDDGTLDAVRDRVAALDGRLVFGDGHLSPAAELRVPRTSKEAVDA
jgi:hypothetical protein